MKLSALQIRQLIAEVFSEACLNEQVQIKEMAEALDTFRLAIEQGRALKCLDELSWNRELYGKEPYLQYMARFQKRYYQILTSEMIAAITAAFKEDSNLGYTAWYHAYADAVICWKDYVYHSLCNHSFPFTANQQQEVNKWKQLNGYIIESDWLAAFPFFEEPARDERLTNEHKSFFNLVLAEIIIYWKPGEDGFAYIEKAKELSPDSEDLLITLGKYHVRKFEYEKGREILFSALSRSKNKTDVCYFIGDTYRDEQKYEAAREWYDKALNTNFLGASVYSRYFSLGGEEANVEEISNMLHYTEVIEKDDPVSPVLYNTYRDASFQFSISGNTEEAINYCKKAIALRPELQTAKIDLAYELFKTGKKEEAVETVTEVTLAHPDSYNAWRALSYFHEMNGHIEEAIAAYNRCIEIRPADKAFIHNQTGLMLKGAGKLKEAIDHYQMAINEKPLVEYYENLRTIYEEAGDDDKMIVLTKQLAEHPSAVNPFNYYNRLGIYFYDKKKNYGKAIEYYQMAIEMKQGDPVLYENIGLAYEGAEDFIQAEEAYKKAVAFEKEKGVYDNRLGYFYYIRAFYQNNETEKGVYLGRAIEYYLVAHKKEPGNVTYISNIALAYEKGNLFNEAAEWHQKNLLINEKNTDALSGMGICSYRLRDYKKAIVHFEKAIALEPWNTFFYDHLGYVYELQNNNTMAIETYENALLAISQYQEKLAPTGLKPDYFYNRIGILLYNSAEKKQAEESLDAYKKAIEINPSQTVYHSNLALSYLYLENYDEAKKEYLTAIELNPHDHNSYNSLGVVYYRMLLLPESIEAYRNAIKIKEDIALYYDNIGLSYFDEKMYKEAEGNWCKALELEPGNSYYILNLKELYRITGQTEKLIALDK
jgi:tetratricopeptide (TPR) repeat protein